MDRAVKSLALVAAAGAVLAAAAVKPASAGTPCWQAVVNDWYDNGRVEHQYAPSCYRSAIAHLPRDVREYSSARDDIRRAWLASLHRNGNGGNGNGTGGPTGPRDTSPTGATNSSGRPSASANRSEGNNKGLILRAIEWLGPSNAASLPLPLVVLAGVAFLLLAAAGGSFVNRRLHERRLPPPPPPA